jgi:hypothetical protein
VRQCADFVDERARSFFSREIGAIQINAQLIAGTMHRDNMGKSEGNSRIMEISFEKSRK